MNDMLLLAQKEEIEVVFFDFIEPIKGIYFTEPDMPPIIGLDYSLEFNTPLLRSIMAEELGHHFTTVNACIPREFYNYSNRLEISKVEYKALKWAANYLIRDNKLNETLKEGIYNIQELANYFLVTKEIMELKLRLYCSLNSNYETA